MPLSKITSNSVSLTTLAASGAATLSSTLGVTGVATLSSSLGVAGVTTFAAGTAALPAITTTGDTNTGLYFPAADTIAFTNGGVESMRINSAGNTFIGVASAVWDERLGVRSVTGTGQVGLGIYSPSATYASSLIRVQSENATGTAYNLFEGRGTGGGVKILIDGNGLVDLKNGQIKFPAAQNASADANTLDDYEEGTWTPGFAFGGASVGATYSSQTGRYTKIGNVVVISAILSLTAKGSSTGAVTITGLPFTAENYGAFSIGQFFNFTYTSGNQIYGYTSATIIQIQQTTSAGALTNVDSTQFTNITQIIFSATYRI